MDETADRALGQEPARHLDEESRDWLAGLRADGPSRDEAISRLHTLLLRAARFEVSRRRAALPHLRGSDLDDVAQMAAGDALVSVLARLDDFRGASRFTTWAYKFALLEAAVKLRKLAWQGREVPLEPESWELELAGSDPDMAIPGLRAHLEGCPVCREEHDSLLALVASDSDSDSDSDS